MLNESICVPFRIPDIYWGLAEVQGILKGGKEGLILDFELKEGVLDTSIDAKVTTIPLADITSIEFQQGWFSRWIEIRVNRLQALHQLPGSHGGEIRLKIRRKNSREAEEFVSSTQMALATCGLKKLMDGLSG